MTVLERVFASSGTEVIIRTLEITNVNWPTSILLCDGFEDQSCVTEDNRNLLFVASGIEVSLPKKGTDGNQSLNFVIDNVNGEAQRLIDMALESGQRINLVFRHYLSSDLTAPAEPPYRFVVKGGGMEGSAMTVSATFFDIINTAWPRKFYTADFAPGVKYIK
jgi:hypothetical protein